MTGNSCTMHCGILTNMPYCFWINWKSNNDVNIPGLMTCWGRCDGCVLYCTGVNLLPIGCVVADAYLLGISIVNGVAFPCTTCKIHYSFEPQCEKMASLRSQNTNSILRSKDGLQSISPHPHKTSPVGEVNIFGWIHRDVTTIQIRRLHHLII